jgi:2-keto-4-pentenoate hydratase/2-oxohepta-3-ene-1,7-dioic acid hydratase in catechol pathway
VIPNPEKIFCVGLNYKTHVAEMKRPDSEHPAIFVRFADSLTAHGAPLPKPKATNRFDYEGELAIIIGKGGRNISQADALHHIAGYACLMTVLQGIGNGILTNGHREKLSREWPLWPIYEV